MTVLLVCGEYAWLALTGETLDHPEQMEGQALSANHLARINKRFKASFSHAWYMGHTRRWSLHYNLISYVLHLTARSAGWEY